MEVENNNNTPVPEVSLKQFSIKRTAEKEEEITTNKIKRLKPNEPEETHVTDIKLIDQRPSQPAQRPKKRLQFGNTKKPKFDKNERFMYGNYKNYYGKRILDKDFHDIRLDYLATQPELFRNKQVLDIGCNSGLLSTNIADKFEAKSLVGLDIDRSLINDAQKAINNLKRRSDLAAGETTGKFPYNVKFVQGNYVLDDDVLLEIERPQFDLILCLSVTKWIHLNFGDVGIKRAFRRMFFQLRPGGKLILEPQSYDTYQRRKKLSPQILDNYNAIKFKPDEFTNYLLSADVGFASMELIGVPDHCKAGFKRPIQIFSKL